MSASVRGALFDGEDSDDKSSGVTNQNDSLVAANTRELGTSPQKRLDRKHAVEKTEKDSGGMLGQNEELKEQVSTLEEQVGTLSGALEKTKAKLEQVETRYLSMMQGAGGEDMSINERQSLLVKIAEAEDEADDLREHVSVLAAKSSELEMVAEEEETMLKEQVETVTAWNMVLETSADQANKELEGARAEVKQLKQSLADAEEKLTSFQSPAADGAGVEKLLQENRSLSLKVNQMEDKVADEHARVLELEACVEEHLTTSSDLKMRLARKSSQLVDLEKELENKPRDIQPLDVTSRSVGQPSKQVDQSAFEEIERENQIMTMKIKRTEASLQEERSKISRLEDELLDKENSISELKARLDEAIDNSADLKMRLAKKGAAIAELEDDIYEMNPSLGAESGGFARSLPSELAMSRELPLFEETTTNFSFDDGATDLADTAANASTSTSSHSNTRSLPRELPFGVDKPVTPTSAKSRFLAALDESTSTRTNDKTNRAGQQPQVTKEDTTTNQFLLDQMSSLVALAEKKKQRLQVLNEKLDRAMAKARSRNLK